MIVAPVFALTWRSSIVLPAPLRRYAGGDVDAVKWRPLGPGIHHMPLVNAEGSAQVATLAEADALGLAVAQRLQSAGARGAH